MMAIVDGGLAGTLTLVIMTTVVKHRHRHFVATGNLMVAETVLLVEFPRKC